jgi:hypothetical protein
MKDFPMKLSKIQQFFQHSSVRVRNRVFLKKLLENLTHFKNVIDLLFIGLSMCYFIDNPQP